MTIEELENRLGALIVEYVASLSHVRTHKVDRVRLEATGEYVHVTYDRGAPEGMPTLVVQIRQPVRK